jgi:glycopeptide antibiotics resistance protein
MRRAFLLGAGLGVLVFLQALLILRMPIHIHVLETWALAWGGVFGLLVGSLFLNTAQAIADLTFAAIGLPLFYGLGALLLRVAYRSFRRMGVVVAAVTLLVIHVGLYLLVVRSVVT